MKSLYEQSKAIVRLIDRGEWKHSWHLPKSEGGSIDWWHPGTLERVKQEKEEAIKEAAELLSLAISIEIPDLDSLK